MVYRRTTAKMLRTIRITRRISKRKAKTAAGVIKDEVLSVAFAYASDSDTGAIGPSGIGWIVDATDAVEEAGAGRAMARDGP